MSRYERLTLARGPVAYWPLDDLATGPLCRDATGHGYDALPGDTTGTLSVGTTPFGCSGPSVRFAVADTSQWAFLYMYGTLPDWPSSRLPACPGAFTYEYWCRLLPGSTNALGLKAFVNTSGDRCSVSGPSADSRFIHGGFIVVLDNSEAFAVDTFDVMSWTYVVGVWTGAQWHLYCNGEPLALIYDAPRTGLGLTPDGMSLGANYQVSFEAAHAAVYDRALSAAEIAAAYAAAGCAILRFTYAPGGGIARWLLRGGAGGRISYHGE